MSIKGKEEIIDFLPTEPTNLEAIDLDIDKVCLCWDSPESGGDAVEKVILKYFTPGEDNMKTSEFENSRKLVLENLSPFTTYNVEVSLKSKYGVSPSSTTTFKTKSNTKQS